MCALETQMGFSRVKTLAGWRAVALWALVAAAALGLSFFFDAAVQAWIAQHQVPGWRAAMRLVSRWGDWPSHVALGLIGAAFAYFLGNRQWLAIFAAMVLACALAGTVNRGIKIVAGRARPSVTTDAGWHGPRLSSEYNAFPSGHTAASTAFFAVLLFARRRVGVPLLAIPLLIAFSRIYIAAHHLSDVVAGALVGILAALVLWRAVQSRMSSAPARATATAT